MTDLARFRGVRGFHGLFLLGRHPWALVVVLVIVAAFVYWQNHRR